MVRRFRNEQDILTAAALIVVKNQRRTNILSQQINVSTGGREIISESGGPVGFKVNAPSEDGLDALEEGLDVGGLGVGLEGGLVRPLLDEGELGGQDLAVRLNLVEDLGKGMKVR